MVIYSVNIESKWLLHITNAYLSYSFSPPPLCGAIPASSDYVAKQGDKVAARVKAVDGDEQWILAEVVSYNHSTNK